MYYKWRYHIIMSCIIVILALLFAKEYFMQPSYKQERERMHVSTIDSTAMANVQYNEEQHIIYWLNDGISLKIMSDGNEVESFIFYEYNQEYLAFFLPKQEEEQVLMAQFNMKGQTKQRIITNTMLTRVAKKSSFFIAQDGYFIRDDKTYVCSESLEKMEEGLCHEESYHLDFVE